MAKKYSELFKLARESIRAELEGRELKVNEKTKKKYSLKKACFVTLTINNELRGCIGSLEARQELWKDVLENSRNAAFNDTRFEKLSLKEFEKIKIEISILSVPEKIEYKDAKDLLSKIKKGKDGLIIKYGFYSATYLPQVWEQISEKQDFLSSLCKKAGLVGDFWKSGKLSVWKYGVDSVADE